MTPSLLSGTKFVHKVVRRSIADDGRFITIHETGEREI